MVRLASTVVLCSDTAWPPRLRTRPVISSPAPIFVSTMRIVLSVPCETALMSLSFTSERKCVPSVHSALPSLLRSTAPVMFSPPAVASSNENASSPRGGSLPWC